MLKTLEKLPNSVEITKRKKVEKCGKLALNIQKKKTFAFSIGLK